MTFSVVIHLSDWLNENPGLPQLCPMAYSIATASSLKGAKNPRLDVVMFVVIG